MQGNHTHKHEERNGREKKRSELKRVRTVAADRIISGRLVSAFQITAVANHQGRETTYKKYKYSTHQGLFAVGVISGRRAERRDTYYWTHCQMAMTAKYVSTRIITVVKAQSPNHQSRVNNRFARLPGVLPTLEKLPYVTVPDRQ